MNYNFFNVLFITLCIGTIRPTLYAQTNYEIWADKALAQLNITERPVGQTAYHLHYDMRMSYWSGAVETASIELEVTAKTARFLTKEVEYYQDEQHSFTVLSEPRKIIWMSTAQADIWKDYTNSFLNLKKEFYQQASYSRVPRQQEPEHTCLLRIVPDQQAQKQSEIDYLLLEFDIRTYTTTRLLVQYTKAVDKKSMEYIYHQLDYNASRTDKRPVQQAIFAGRNQLVSRFKGYELVDMRQER